MPRWDGTVSPQFGGGALSVSGGFPSALPGATSGSAVVLPAGILRGSCSATSFSSSQTGLAVEVYLDGVSVGVMKVATAHALNQHTTLCGLGFAATVTAGTHYLYFRQIQGTSDGGDIATFVGVVTPS